MVFKLVNTKLMYKPYISNDTLLFPPNLGTALSFKISLRYPKDVYFIAKMPNFAHSDAEAPPSVFLYHINKNF